MSGRTLRLSQLHTTALFPNAFTENVSTKAATVKFTLADEAGRAFSMTLVFKRYNTGCAASSRARVQARQIAHVAVPHLSGACARLVLVSKHHNQGTPLHRSSLLQTDTDLRRVTRFSVHFVDPSTARSRKGTSVLPMEVAQLRCPAGTPVST